ncbi:MAG TPA: hypothetical protein VGK06_09090 [Methanosarcina sp.]
MSNLDHPSVKDIKKTDRIGYLISIGFGIVMIWTGIWNRYFVTFIHEKRT